MLAIARYALKGPFHAATVAGVLAVLSLFVPLVSILSGAIIGLVILTQGLRPGLWVIGVSVVGITLVSYLITRSPVLGITIAVVQWLPMVLLAEVLRRTASFSFTLLVGAGMSLLLVVVQFLLWPDAQQIWLQYLNQMFAGMEQQDAATQQQLEAVLRNMVQWMTVLVVAVMFSTFVATLMVSRWFQARLADSDAHRSEFHAISLGKNAAGLAIALIVAALLLQQNMLIALAMVMAAAFMFQGLAIAHSWARQRNARMWLFVAYALMIFVPQTAALVALLGIVDNWVGLRAKLPNPPGQTD